jgi:hypothetical protein
MQICALNKYTDVVFVYLFIYFICVGDPAASGRPPPIGLQRPPPGGPPPPPQ